MKKREKERSFGRTAAESEVERDDRADIIEVAGDSREASVEERLESDKDLEVGALTVLHKFGSSEISVLVMADLIDILFTGHFSRFDTRESITDIDRSGEDSLLEIEASLFLLEAVDLKVSDNSAILEDRLKERTGKAPDERSRGESSAHIGRDRDIRPELGDSALSRIESSLEVTLSGADIGAAKHINRRDRDGVEKRERERHGSGIQVLDIFVDKE